jgi:hypothetical protein
VNSDPTPEEITLREALAGGEVATLNTPALRAAFLRLPVRQWGLPTGVQPWRMWRTEQESGCWRLAGFLPHGEDHCRVASVWALLLPDGATVTRDPGVVLRAAGREFFYGPNVGVGLVQWDAWAATRG